MTVPIGSIECSNSNCGHGNPASARSCAVCGAPLLRQFLYAIGPSLQGLAPGTWVANRYFYLGDRRFLDGRPAKPPDVPAEVTRQHLSYLRLFEQRPHVPQIYGMAKHASVGREPILLLEGAPIAPDGSLLPKLLDQWPTQSPLRQLNWLWQMARLWTPLQEADVVATLLDPDRLRVGGGWVQLLSLKDNAGRSPSVAELGRWWVQRLVPHPSIEPALSPLFQKLALGAVEVETLVGMIEQLIAQVTAQDWPVTLAVATLSDPGPSRSRNEDACYPASPGKFTSQRFGLAIVCDGLGGHEGGDVASQLAIEVLTSQLVPFVQSATVQSPTAEQVIGILMGAIRSANTAIAQRNTNEGRAERQRMGTTVVLALVIDRVLYLAHVGDSRAYQITATGCYPLTLDDDLATREARLGLGFYHDLLQVGAAGALVQALGMGNSEQLYPSVRQILLDEDCAIVLCSDGVSDFDLIEREGISLFSPGWDQADPSVTVAQAIALANRHNGHDNATVGLMQIGATRQVSPTLPIVAAPIPVVAPETLGNAAVAPLPTNPIDPPPGSTQLATPVDWPAPPEPRRGRSAGRSPGFARWMGAITGLILGGGLLALVVMPLVRQLIDANAPRSTPPPTAPATSPGSPVQTPAPLPLGAIGRIQPQAAALGLYDAPDRRTPIAWLAPSSTVQILALQAVPPIAPLDPSRSIAPPPSPAAAPSLPSLSPSPPVPAWVQIKICAFGQPSAATLQPGAVFWVRQADLADRLTPIAAPGEPKVCVPTVLSPGRTNTPP